MCFETPKHLLRLVNISALALTSQLKVKPYLNLGVQKQKAEFLALLLTGPSAETFPLQSRQWTCLHWSCAWDFAAGGMDQIKSRIWT